ncbi:LolA family protein [Frondihabitans australicus]|uniref:Uncharacterized protein DUF2092 n=1 Tax=Frondihabitans australicus TaxID=386892 RepID=A0A495IFY1_9MICO|nr:DUF2092 domain-containing protein [Frondihabitans australicus]RKR74923.1 uncharacterized protein DUF2092 [Frondihabitans australicus]
MTLESPTSKARLRWIPALAVPAAVVAAVIAVPQMANADVKLPSKTPAAIVALAESSQGVSFSGTVSETANLGLPDISSSALGGGSDSDSVSSALSQLTGTHTAKVYVSGTTASRIQTLDNLAERDVIRNGDSIWTYDSKSNSAVHITLPAKGVHATPQTDTGQASMTPQSVTAEVLKNVKKYSTVSTSENVKVAGRTAYGLTVTPKTSKTLVKSVTLDIDSATGVPLRATILAKGQTKPAFEVGFTDISFSNPSASVFSFTPPKGASVKNVSPAEHSGLAHGVQPGVQTQSGEAATAQQKAQAKYKSALAKYDPQVLGSGWTTILSATLPNGAAGLSAGGGQSSQLLNQVLTRVDGGRVLQTALVSVYISDSGKVYVGAVSAATLEAEAASQK